LWRASSSYRPVRAVAVRKCSKCCQHFRVFRGRALFVRGVMNPYFSVGPSRQRETLVWLPRRVGSLGIPWRIHSLVKKALHRHRAGFDLQRASPFMKSVKASQILGEAVSLCHPLHCWWCWRALPVAISTLVKSLHCADHHPIRIGDEREWLVTASPVMTKSRAPAGGNYYPENGLVNPPRRDTRGVVLALFNPTGSINATKQRNRAVKFLTFWSPLPLLATLPRVRVSHTSAASLQWRGRRESVQGQIQQEE
jgi:hypothetical protein